MPDAAIGRVELGAVDPDDVTWKSKGLFRNQGHDQRSWPRPGAVAQGRRRLSYNHARSLNIADAQPSSSFSSVASTRDAPCEEAISNTITPRQHAAYR